MIFIMLSTDPVKQKLEKQQREMEKKSINLCYHFYEIRIIPKNNNTIETNNDYQAVQEIRAFSFI